MLFREVQQFYNNDTKDMGINWEPYRFMNTEQVYKVIFSRNQMKFRRALILGAGNGNDINVNYLGNTFNEITLVDIDDNALDRFIAKSKFPHKFTKKIIDLSGVEHKMNNNLATKSEKEIEAVIRNSNPRHDFSSLEGQYDFILNANYTSQLVNPYIFSILAATSRNMTKGITEELGHLSARIITSLFDHIHALLEKDGIFIHSTDLFEVSGNEKTGYKSPAFGPVMKALNGSMTNIQNLYDPAVMISLSKYMVVGNYLPKDNKFKFESLRCIPWKFFENDDEIRYYICRVIAFKKG